MVRLSVSQAARIVGVSRLVLQQQINTGALATHEGYLTMEDLKQANPEVNAHSEQDKRIKKMADIKENARQRIGKEKAMDSKNVKRFKAIIEKLNKELYQEQCKNEHFEMVLSEVSQKLVHLEECCEKQDKSKLHQINSWLYTKTKH
jgi:CDP-4-dehydro-6-deoxyglucose reductase